MVKYHNLSIECEGRFYCIFMKFPLGVIISCNIFSPCLCLECSIHRAHKQVGRQARPVGAIPQDQRREGSSRKEGMAKYRSWDRTMVMANSSLVPTGIDKGMRSREVVVSCFVICPSS